MSESSRSRVFAPGLLEGRVCLVSGAGTGFGRDAALEMARLGAVVVGCGRRTEPLEETASLAEGLPGSFGHAQLDIRDEEAVDAFVEEVVAGHGRVDVLVNNAGGQFLSPAEAITPKGFRTVIELNVTGTWLMTHAVATKSMIPGDGGKVISVTLSPHNGMPGMVHSGAARAAVENMMRTLSIEWSRFGVTTCALAAGQFATDTLLSKYPRQIVESLPDTVPVGRIGDSEEMAWMIAYLASDAGRFHSGSVITIDGARDNWFGPWPPGTLRGEGGGLPPEERRA